MKRIALPLLALSAVVVTLLSAAPFPQEAPVAEAQAIVDKALARAAWSNEQGFEARFRRTMTEHFQKYDRDGGVTDEVTRSYVVEPHQGIPYKKLLTKNGEPIAGNDLSNEKRRWEEFLQELEEPPKSAQDDEDPFGLVFDEELIGRYTIELAGVRTLRGRPTFVLEFEPRPGRLPVRRRLDHALNRSSGEIWVDQETHEIARLTFQLVESVKLWWGILGSVSNATGRVERRPLTEDAWLPEEVDVYYHYRVLIKTSRHRETTRWSDFRADL